MLKGQETLRLLLATPSTDQAESIVSCLKNLGIATRPSRVDDFEELIESLDEGRFDILVTAEQIENYYLEGLLGAIRKLGRDIPVIVIVSSPGNELKIRALESGAADALPADEPTLIALVVRREMVNLQARRSQRRLESELKESETRNRFLLDNSSESIAYLHDGMHIYENRAYVNLFGYENRDDLTGIPIIDLVDPHDLSSFKTYLKSHTRKLESPGNTDATDIKELHFQGLKKDSSTFKAVMTLSNSTFDGEPCTQIIIRTDTTGEVRAEMASQSRELQERLLEASTLDMVTGLANRKQFEESLYNAVTQAHLSKATNALVYISIDRFNQLTVTYGPLSSDQIIQAVADQLVQLLGKKYLFRFADSTLTALMPDIEETALQDKLNAILKQVEHHVLQLQDGRNLLVTLSIGLVCFSETARHPEELLALAAAENSRAGERGGNRLCTYDPGQDATNSSTAMQEVLNAALAKNRFKLLFQSLVDVKEDGMPFYEVYLRLPVNDGQILEPEQFLPTAIQSKRDRLALKIDRWVLLNACKQLKEHLKMEPNARILINLSADSLLDVTLPEWIGKLARATSKNRGTLVLQFQEQDVINYLNQAAVLATQLNQVGCDFSISRFGLSLEPLNILQRIPASYIKLDGSFTRDMESNENLEQLRNLVNSLNEQKKNVIIPFVESTATLSKLWTMGVRYLQGYFLHTPGERLGTAE